jgi:pyruvate-formate lyase
MKIGKKEKITLRGVIQTYTRRLYPGDIYTTEKVLVKHTKESLKQLLVDFISLKWLRSSLSTYGTGGFASLRQYYLTQVLIAVCLLAALGLMWLIVYKT